MPSSLDRRTPGAHIHPELRWSHDQHLSDSAQGKSVQAAWFDTGQEPDGQPRSISASAAEQRRAFVLQAFPSLEKGKPR